MWVMDANPINEKDKVRSRTGDSYSVKGDYILGVYYERPGQTISCNAR